MIFCTVNKTVKMNFKLWTVMSVLALLTFVNGNPSKRTAGGKVAHKNPHLGNCKTDEDCPGDAVCMPPGFGQASENAQKKCYATICTCPGSWIRYNNMCYLIELVYAGNWQDARDFCVDKGGKLAEPQTSVENDFIKQQIQDTGLYTFRKKTEHDGTAWFWFGLTNITGNGYVWDYTGLPPTYTDWGTDVFGNDCASYDPPTFQWALDACFWWQRPICEKPVTCDVILL